MYELNKKYVLITGASSGIGKAVVDSCIKAGLSPILAVRDVEGVKKQFKEKIAVIKIDFFNLDTIRPAVDAVSNIVGKALLYGLVNCAGVNLPGPLESIDSARLEEQFRINVFGPMELTRNCISMLRKSSGKIITVGSKLGRIGAPFLGPYCSSKAACRRLNDSLRLELAPFGIQVIFIEPGSIKTPIWEKTKQASLKFWRKQPKGLQSLYHERIKATIEGASAIQGSGIDAEVVANKIVKVLTGKLSKPWVGIGKDTFTTAILAKILPIHLMDRLIIISRSKSTK